MLYMPASENKIQIGIWVPKELKAELEQIAKEQDRSMSNLLTIILKDYVNKKKNQNEFLQAKNKE